MRWPLILVLVGLVWAQDPVAADPTAPAKILGYWMSEKRDGCIEVRTCGQALCGRLVWIRDKLDEDGKKLLDSRNPDPSLRQHPVEGLTILTEFPLEPDSRGEWKGGRIYDPRRGDSYKCKMRLAGPDILRIRGYLWIPILGKTTTWNRIGEAP